MPREVGDTSMNSPCMECGWRVRHAREYHPFVACIIVKATGRDPLPYLRQVAADMATVNDKGQFPLPVEEVAVPS